MSKSRDAADWARFQPQRKNLLFNGGMNVWQRGTSSTGLTNGSAEYVADRWLLRMGTTTAVVDMTQSTDVPSTLGGYSLKVDVTTADATIGASDFTILDYRLEGFDSAALQFGSANAETITLSFWVKSPKVGIHCVAFKNGSADRSYTTEYTVDAANVWQRIIITVAGDVTGTWSTDNTSGLYLAFILAMGSDWDMSPDVWTAGDTYKTTNQVNVTDNAANTFLLTGLQLEVGDQATDFEYRPYADELALCKRYYHRVLINAGGSVWYRYGTAGLTFMDAALVTFPSEMRIAPDRTNLTALTLTNCSAASWTSTVVDSSLSVTVTAAGKYRALVNDTEFDAEIF